MTHFISIYFTQSCFILFHNSDGSTQQLAGCLRDFRNKPFATRARIEYYQNTLTVSILENFLVSFTLYFNYLTSLSDLFS